VSARICFGILAASAALAQAPPASVSGSVFDEMGGPVISAKLSLRGDGRQLYLTRTTEQGTFQFLRMEAGRYTLVIDQLGFCKSEIDGIEVAAGEKKSLPRITLQMPAQSGECAGTK
jgi:hypothetical protein